MIQDKEILNYAFNASFKLNKNPSYALITEVKMSAVSFGLQKAIQDIAQDPEVKNQLKKLKDWRIESSTKNIFVYI